MQVVQEQEYIYPVERYNLDSNKVNLAIGIQDSSWHNFIDESIYTLRAEHVYETNIFNNETNKNETNTKKRAI